MRVTMPHRTSKQEAMRAVDLSFDDLFRGLPIAALQITNTQRSWNGSVMSFAFQAKMGFLHNPIHGTVEVTDKEITVDADLGFLERLISQASLKTRIETSFQKLLPGSGSKT